MAATSLDCTEGYPLDKRLSAKYKDIDTFGSVTLKERLPKVLTQIIDTLHRYNPTIAAKHNEEGTKQLKSVLSKLAELRYRMQTDKTMLPIERGPDITEWQQVFEVYRNKLGSQNPHWFSVSWLFFECYMYRKVIEVIREEPLLSEYDPFQSQKESSFVDSIDQMKSISTQVVKYITTKPPVNQKMLTEYLMLSLWGNKADLSMAATMESYEMSHSHSQDNLQQYILADHSQLIWDLLTSPERENNREIAIVLDNSGFELFSDFVLAEFLLSSGLCDHVSLYCKYFPWFISDATTHDIEWTLQQLTSSQHEPLVQLGQHLTQRITNKTISIKVHHFWTTSYEYSAMKRISPDLYAQLSQAKLVIFKGDLNYRKLVADRNWSYTQSFSIALQEFRPTNILALRTLKADLVTGLPQGAADRAVKETSDWMISGKFAVIQAAIVE